MSKKPSTVAEYFGNLDLERKAALTKLRRAVKKALPKAKETLAYGMPTYEISEKPVCAFASQKRYMALYVMDTDVVEKHRDKLQHLSVGKSCIRFRSLEDLPLKMVDRMLKEARPRSS